jgi:hypothetical protein
MECTQKIHYDQRIDQRDKEYKTIIPQSKIDPADKKCKFVVQPEKKMSQEYNQNKVLILGHLGAHTFQLDNQSMC